MTELLKTPGAWPRILLARADAADPTDLDAAVRAGAFDALKTAVRAMTPGQVIAAIAGSGLRGRAGRASRPARSGERGGPPTARGSTSWPGYGADPAVQVDRTLLELDLYAVIEARPLPPGDRRHGGVHRRPRRGDRGIRRSSPPLAAAEAGFVGPDVLESGWGLRVEIRPVQGAYLLGEETVLLRRSGQARPARAAPAAPHRARAVRPPDGRPQRPDPGGGAVDRQARSGGIRRDRLEGEPRHDPSSSFAPGRRRDRRGPAGDQWLRELVGLVGDGDGRAGLGRRPPAQGAARRRAVGGPRRTCSTRPTSSTRCGRPAPRRLRSTVVADDRACVVDLARLHPVLRQTRPAARRSCRIGTRRSSEIADRIAGGTPKPTDLDLGRGPLADICGSALCDHERLATLPMTSAMRYFRAELDEHLLRSTCPAGVCHPIAVAVGGAAH